MNNDKNNIIIAGVVGWPISHSLSPRLHKYWLEQYQIPGDYLAYEVKPEQLEQFVKSMAEKHIVGLNLTVPHKEIVFPYVDHVDDHARKIGAVNMLTLQDGKLQGINTDGYGFLANLKDRVPHWKADQGPAVIIGAGGAARAAIVSLLEEGVPEVRLTNRTRQRAEKLKDIYRDSRIKVFDWADRAMCLPGSVLLVNTTTLGMKNQPELDLDLSNLSKGAVVYDIVYNPLRTTLLQQAERRGNFCVDGLGMLLYQAVPAFQKWFGQRPDVNQKLRDHMLAGLI